jgi:NADH-quinone oxidoreductase subunit A
VMVATYVPLLLLLAAAMVVVLGFFGAAQYLGPRNPNPEKSAPFESGNPSAGAHNVRMSVKFYRTAILFVVFDIEAVFLYIWAAHFRAQGWTGLGVMGGFLAVLIVGLVYALGKGALQWQK